MKLELVPLKEKAKEARERGLSYGEIGRILNKNSGQVYKWLNPERAKEIRRRHYLKHRDETIAKAREYFVEHPEVNRRACKKWYEKNREECLKRKRDWNALHKEHKRKRDREYYAANRERILKLEREKKYGENAIRCLERDNYTCQKCRKKLKLGDRTINIHHIDFDETNNDLRNLILLCASCHRKVHRFTRDSFPLPKDYILKKWEEWS